MEGAESLSLLPVPFFLRPLTHHRTCLKLLLLPSLLFESTITEKVTARPDATAIHAQLANRTDHAGWQERSDRE
jgi:hypothetical protein